MNLYRINVRYIAPTNYHDQTNYHDSIKTYLVAKNESDLYDLISSFTDWESYEAKTFCVKNIPYFPTYEGYTQEEYEQLQKDFIISTKGEMYAYWADWETYREKDEGITHYGWELAYENISLADITRLERLGILD